MWKALSQNELSIYEMKTFCSVRLSSLKKEQSVSVSCSDKLGKCLVEQVQLQFQFFTSILSKGQLTFLTVHRNHMTTTLYNIIYVNRLMFQISCEHLNSTK